MASFLREVSRETSSFWQDMLSGAPVFHVKQFRFIVRTHTHTAATSMPSWWIVFHVKRSKGSGSAVTKASEAGLQVQNHWSAPAWARKPGTTRNMGAKQEIGQCPERQKPPADPLITPDGAGSLDPTGAERWASESQEGNSGYCKCEVEASARGVSSRAIYGYLQRTESPEGFQSTSVEPSAWGLVAGQHDTDPDVSRWNLYPA